MGFRVYRVFGFRARGLGFIGFRFFRVWCLGFRAFMVKRVEVEGFRCCGLGV